MMPESLKHMDLVKLLEGQFNNLVPKEYQALIYIDKPENTFKPPRTSLNFVPDCFYEHDKMLIIGEAKTINDVDRKHSINQLENYYLDAVNYNGDSILVLSVPWQAKNTMKNMMRRIKKKYEKNIKIIVVCELGRSEEI